MITYCKKCVLPSTRPGLGIDAEGICLPCRFAEKHSSIDWKARQEELKNIAIWGRENSQLSYDCIVAVSGGKDSLRQALYARDELGLKPLLVSCSYPPEQQSTVGASNLSNIIEQGFDTITVGPSPQKWRQLMRNAFFRFGNWAKATEIALYSIPPRFAMAYNIPLIFLGENNAISYGDLGGSFTGDANRIKYNNTLSGGDPSPMMDEWMKRSDILWHYFPQDEEMARRKVRIVYLGYYIEDFNIYRNAEISIDHGLQVRDVPPEEVGAYSNFEDLDEDFVHVNQMLKFFKLGFARVSDEVSTAIRTGKMTRDEAIEIARLYDGKCADRYIHQFCDFIGITWEKFWQVANSFRNQEIWEQKKNGEWILKISPT